MKAVVAVVLLAVVSSSCVEELRTYCTQDEDCVQGQFCHRVIRRCVNEVGAPHDASFDAGAHDASSIDGGVQPSRRHVVLLIDGTDEMMTTSIELYDRCGGVTSTVAPGALLATVLNGCDGYEGIFDFWNDWMEFSVMTYGASPSVVVPFRSTIDELKAGVDELQFSGSGDWELTAGLYDAARRIQELSLDDDSAILVISSRFWSTGFVSFDLACDGSVEHVGAQSVGRGAVYLWDNDFNCSEPGKQSISVWSLATSYQWHFNSNTAYDVAFDGGGDFGEGHDSDSLRDAFNRLLAQIRAR